MAFGGVCRIDRKAVKCCGVQLPGCLMRPQQTKKFCKDLKRVAQSGKNHGKIKIIVSFLANGDPLHPKHRDNTLIGEWKGSQ